MPRSYGEPEYRRRIREKAENQQREAESVRRHRENRNTIDGIIGEIGAIRTQAQAHNDDHDRKWRCERLGQWCEIGALTTAAVVGLIAICVSSNDAHQQRLTMQAQLGAMVAEARPWIKIDTVLNGAIGNTGPLLTIPIYITRTNIGRSTAIGILTNAHAYSDSEMHKTGGYEGVVKDTCPKKAPRDFGSVVLPGMTSYEYSDWTRSISIEAAQEKGAGHYLAYVVVCSAYYIPSDAILHTNGNLYSLERVDQAKSWHWSLLRTYAD